ncbi:10761_t:CDS:2, partial [Racocetra fulgida]
RGEVGGPRPIIFNGFRADTFLFDVFSVGKNVGNYIEFGAEQVIIVRNDDTKKKVKEQIKGGGLVMTVFEAKGMEFSDVLLARQHIWIFDENDCPIRTYWERQGLVKVVGSKEEISTLPTLAKKSSSHEWNKRGKEFFEQKQFDQAILCFEKSGNEPHRKLANAWLLKQEAEDSINSSDRVTVKSLFIRAALAFKDCSKPVQAATCYRNAEKYKEAGDIYCEWNMYTEAVIAYKDDEKIFYRITRLVNIHYRRENNRVMSKKALDILPKQEQIELLRDHAPEELLEVCEKSGEFRVAAKDLRLRGKFKEAADLFITSGSDKDDRPQKRKISPDSPLIHFMNGMNGDNDAEGTLEVTDDRHVYDVEFVRLKISKFLASYIFKLIWNIYKDGKNILEIGSRICPKFASCQNTAYVLYSRRLLKEEQSKEIRGPQRRWTENLVKLHIRYQSPQTSCPEITYMVLNKLPRYTRYGFSNLAKIWLENCVSNFKTMLKCMFVFQQQRDYFGIQDFYQKMTTIEQLSHPENLPHGFEYYHGYYQAIPVGKRLSSFFYYLRRNRVIDAIFEVKAFIRYTINKAEYVNMKTHEAFADLVTLVESMVLELFKRLNNQSQAQIMDFQKYLMEREISRLVGIMKNDLIETEFSTKELLPLQFNTKSTTSVDDDDNDDTSVESEDNEEKEQLISTRFYQILGSPRAQKAIKTIKDWLFRVLDRQKSRHRCDHILDKVYSDMQTFCQDLSHWEAILKEKEKQKVLRIYKILLRGQTVDIIVNLIKLQGKMDSIKDKLHKSVNNFSEDDKIENCLELLDELKFVNSFIMYIQYLFFYYIAN